MNLGKVLKGSLIAIIFFGLALTAGAQTLDPGVPTLSPDQSGLASPKITVQVIPKNPRPGDSVEIDLVSSWTDLNQSEIVWSENGITTKSGMGATKYFVTAGKNGSLTDVSVAVKTVESEIFQYDIPIRPASIDLIWQTDSLVPPFYRGKALYPRLGKLKIAALANIYDNNGQALDNGSLNYTWKLNSTVLGDRSGIGKSALSITEDIYRTPFTISVTAASADGKYAADGTVTIDAATPIVELYENNPVYGILYNNALSSTFRLPGNQAVFDSFPYYFEARNRFDPLLKYSWTLNYSAVGGQNGPTISLANQNNQSGTADLSLQVINLGRFFEGGNAGLNITFGQNQ